MNQIKFLLISQLKRSRLAEKKNSGFTLIEVLVAMILAALVLTPLLGFMINILDSDRKEQAKSTTEQEVKSALDYIAQDLSQAVFIYDAAALNTNSSTTPTNSGIKDQIPPVQAIGGCSNTNCKPVLVFWKRKFLSSADIGNFTGGNDTFVYSLVGYYLITDGGSNGAWSNTARIGRFEIKDGIPNPNRNTRFSRQDNGKTVYYDKLPDKGFKLFDLSKAGDLATKMKQWVKHPELYNITEITNHPISAILIDYVDKAANGATCPVTTPAQTPTSPTPGFYACVNATGTTAQVFMRGNALERVRKNPPAVYSPNQSTYFPTASIRVQGRGFLYTK
ncbi:MULTISPECIES: hormogonium polysaccharide secretion pseudopilin HpsC [Cyanophyceae]|uniref:hormogonium polysaccharide secretion pseudopilin HpsC n=1 Tax=Cyanophyceae TaxID=3028117 RepID=UPI001686B781|nr:hormogonium polysaccharide secretion pseudopilin HpsC [Trichocoleus sp. FACHB-69]MBD1932522.1 prepilin-type N-terminal cleavage/methylation domain-containing protein [Trichocoleus sp. FACHB-69]